MHELLGYIEAILHAWIPRISDLIRQTQHQDLIRATFYEDRRD